jgi:hypothetical protein
VKSVDTYNSTKLDFNQQHVMLLHRSDEEDAATKYVNEALGRGYQPSIFQLMEIIIITHHIHPK